MGNNYCLTKGKHWFILRSQWIVLQSIAVGYLVTERFMRMLSTAWEALNKYLCPPELIIYTTAYMTIHLTFEDLFIVGSLNTAVKCLQNSSPKKKINFNSHQSASKHTYQKKTGSFHSAASFLVYLTVAGSSTEENNFSVKAIRKKCWKRGMQKMKM